MKKKNTCTISGILMLLLTYPACSQHSREPAATISVATYNIHHTRSSYHGVRNAIRSLNADIVALQEVPVRNGTDYSGRLARDLGYRHISGGMYYRQNRRSGWVLSFLSRYPVSSKKEILLSGSRRALRIDIKIKNQPLAVITTHLSPFVLSRNIIGDNRARSALRKNQISEILRWTGNAARPAVIMGDMNSIYLMGELTPFPDNRFFDVFDSSSTDCPGTFPLAPSMRRKIQTVVPFAPSVITLDYIFVSPGIEVISAGVKKSTASDHYPVTATLRIKKGA